MVSAGIGEENMRIIQLHLCPYCEDHVENYDSVVCH